MITKDYSAAPKIARGTHMFFGATRYHVRSLPRLAFVWWKVSRRMRSMPGYMGHFLWFRLPATFGNVSLWDSKDHMMAFARSKEHRRAIAWLAKPGVARAAFIRFLQADASGHSLGEWRAEPDGEAWRQPQFLFSSYLEGVSEHEDH
jgi:heme-degrading monooxygenase HmoA